MNTKETAIVMRAIHSLRDIHYGLDKAPARLRLSNEVYEDLVTQVGEERAKKLWPDICQAAKEL